MPKQLIVLIAIIPLLITMTTPLGAETKGEPGVKRTIASPAGKITGISGNTITITDDRGRTKTLEMETTKGLAIGDKTGWCEEDCGRLKIGDQTIRVQRVIESRR